MTMIVISFAPTSGGVVAEPPIATMLELEITESPSTRHVDINTPRLSSTIGTSQLATSTPITIRARSSNCGYDVSDTAITHVTAGATTSDPNARDSNAASVALPSTTAN